MVTDRYIPQPLPDWSEIIAQKDAEIARLNDIIQNMRYAEDEDKIKVMIENIRLERRVKELEALLYAQERQFHVDMGR